MYRSFTRIHNFFLNFIICNRNLFRRNILCPFSIRCVYDREDIQTYIYPTSILTNFSRPNNGSLPKTKINLKKSRRLMKVNMPITIDFIYRVTPRKSQLRTDPCQNPLVVFFLCYRVLK